MKKLFMTTALAVSVLLCANSQSRDQGNIEVTPYIGYSSYFHNGDHVEGTSSRNAVRFGVSGDYYFNDRWSLRSGLNYDTMGVKAGRSELVSDYLSIPLNANWHFGSTRKWNLNFGVTPSFLLKGEIDNDDVKDLMKSFQLGISYGIGYKLEVSESFSLLLDTQGFFGLSEVYDTEDALKRLNAGSSFNLGGVFVF